MRDTPTHDAVTPPSTQHHILQHSTTYHNTTVPNRAATTHRSRPLP